MPRSALPLELQDVENHFPDDEQFGTTTWFGRLYRRLNKTTKTWFAFSYRCTEWWAKWRKYPFVLFAIGGEGLWRYENEERDLTSYLQAKTGHGWWLSRVQYYKRWHIALQWPLMLSVHFYPKREDVPISDLPRPDVDGKLWFFYWSHFDADLVYWMFTSLYLGRNWK